MVKPRRHHVKVKETEDMFILDGSIHIPKARTYAKQEVAAYLGRWDVDEHKKEQLYEKRLNRYAKSCKQHRKSKDNSKPKKYIKPKMKK